MRWRIANVSKLLRLQSCVRVKATICHSLFRYNNKHRLAQRPQILIVSLAIENSTFASTPGKKCGEVLAEVAASVHKEIDAVFEKFCVTNLTAIREAAVTFWTDAPPEPFRDLDNLKTSPFVVKMRGEIVKSAARVSECTFHIKTIMDMCASVKDLFRGQLAAIALQSSEYNKTLHDWSS